MSLKRCGDSNAEGARSGYLIPTRDEPERGNLLMNANQHEELGKAQLERNGGSAERQPENHLGHARHRGKVRLYHSGSEASELQQTRQARTRRCEAFSGEGNGHKPSTTDPADHAVDEPQDDRTETRTSAELCATLSE